MTVDRVELWPVDGADLDWLVTHWNRPAVCRFLFDGTAPSRPYIERVIADSSTGWPVSGSCLWTVRACADPVPVGVAGLRPLDDLGPELYYSLEPDAWGHGFASAAARKVLDHARDNLGIRVVHAEVDAANDRSRRTLERLGLTWFDTADGVLGELLRFRVQLA